MLGLVAFVKPAKLTAGPQASVRGRLAAAGVARGRYCCPQIVEKFSVIQ